MDLKRRSDKIRKILRALYPEVDTHVARLSERLGLTGNKDPIKIEFDLMEIVPERAWNDFSLQLIFFGRQTCTARHPKCPECPLNKLCPWPLKLEKTK